MPRELYWLPADPDWPARVKAIETLAEPAARWDALVALANARIDFIRTNRLDSALRKHFAAAPPAHLTTRPIRLAVLAASTAAHLLPAIRVAALRRNLWLTTYEPDYGQYLQELLNPDSGLHRFRPSAVLVALDGRHLFGAVDAAADAGQGDAALDEALGRLEEIWRLAKERCGAAVIQQTVLNVFPRLLGENEHRLPGSRHHLVERLNQALRRAAADGTPISWRSIAMPPRTGWPPGTTRCCGTTPSRRSARPRRRSMAIWSAGCWRRARACRAKASCSTSTTRCGAASSAMTGWRAS